MNDTVVVSEMVIIGGEPMLYRPMRFADRQSALDHLRQVKEKSVEEGYVADVADNLADNGSLTITTESGNKFRYRVDVI